MVLGLVMRLIFRGGVHVKPECESLYDCSNKAPQLPYCQTGESGLAFFAPFDS